MDRLYSYQQDKRNVKITIISSIFVIFIMILLSLAAISYYHFQNHELVLECYVSILKSLVPLLIAIESFLVSYYISMERFMGQLSEFKVILAQKLEIMQQNLMEAINNTDN